MKQLVSSKSKLGCYSGESSLQTTPEDGDWTRFDSSSFCSLLLLLQQALHPQTSPKVWLCWPRGAGLLHHAGTFSHVDISFEYPGSSPWPVEWSSTSNVQEALHLLWNSWPKSSPVTLLIWKLFSPFLETFCSLSCTNHTTTRSLEESLSHPYSHKWSRPFWPFCPSFRKQLCAAVYTGLLLSWTILGPDHFTAVKW